MKERLAKQRQQLNSRLGLDVASSLGMDLSGAYSNDDLLPVKAPSKSDATRVSYLVLFELSCMNVYCWP